MLARAVMSETFGPPQAYRLAEIELSELGPLDVLLSIRAAGVSFVDVLMAEGRYQVDLPLPAIPGIECAGTVLAIGEDVTSVDVGDRVLSTRASGRAFSDAAVLPVDKVFRFPDTLSFEEAACFKVNYTTAYHALVQRGSLSADETVLVLGAGGGVGVAAVQVAKALGANVIASASTAERRQLAAQAGADHVLDSRSESWRRDLKDANSGRPVDVVVDPVGGVLTEQAFRSLAWGGRYLMVGFASGDIPSIPANLAILKGAALIGVDVHQFTYRDPETAMANLDALFALSAQGQLRPIIGERYPLREFQTAMTRVKTGAAIGRVVLAMGEG